MTGSTLDVDALIANEDQLARAIAHKYDTWNMYRNTWLQEKQELRSYLFATDTRTTSNNANGWSNSTTIPKLTQIRDNLHANYMAALFPHRQWLQWIGDSEDAVSTEKAKVIEHYFLNKLDKSKFQTTTSQLVLDFIDYGNVFVMSDWESKVKEDPISGETIRNYAGRS